MLEFLCKKYVQKESLDQVIFCSQINTQEEQKLKLSFLFVSGHPYSDVLGFVTIKALRLSGGLCSNITLEYYFC